MKSTLALLVIGMIFTIGFIAIFLTQILIKSEYLKRAMFISSSLAFFFIALGWLIFFTITQSFNGNDSGITVAPISRNFSVSVSVPQ